MNVKWPHTTICKRAGYSYLHFVWFSFTTLSKCWGSSIKANQSFSTASICASVQMTTTAACCHHQSSCTMSHCFICSWALVLIKVHRSSQDVLGDKRESLLLSLRQENMTAAIFRRTTPPHQPAATIPVLVVEHTVVLIASPVCLGLDLHIPTDITTRDNRFVLNTRMNTEEESKGALERQRWEQMQTGVDIGISNVCVFL